MSQINHSVQLGTCGYLWNSAVRVRKTLSLHLQSFDSFLWWLASPPKRPPCSAPKEQPIPKCLLTLWLLDRIPSQPAPCNTCGITMKRAHFEECLYLSERLRWVPEGEGNTISRGINHITGKRIRSNSPKFRDIIDAIHDIWLDCLDHNRILPIDWSLIPEDPP